MMGDALAMAVMQARGLMKKILPARTRRAGRTPAQ
jgi:hypothetical protein